jgi:hypothetical protein
VPQGLFGEPSQVMTERGRLGRLQVGLVGPQRGRVPCGLAGDLIGEGGDVGVQAEQLVPDGQAEGDGASFGCGRGLPVAGPRVR